MNVIEAMNSRYAARAFKPRQIEKDTLLQIISAATRTPSWADTQPWEVFVAAGEPLERLRQACLDRHLQGVASHPDLAKPLSWPPALADRMSENGAHRMEVMGVGREDQEFRRQTTQRNFQLFGAPVVLYLCMERDLTPWSIFDIGMFAQSLMLAAQEYGVDSMPAVNLVAYPDLIRAELGIKSDLMILMGIALGYADHDQILNKPRSLRRPVDEVVRFIGI